MDRGVDGYRPEHILQGYWKETNKILLKLPDTVVSNQWVIENVLPTLSNIRQHSGGAGSEYVNHTHESYEDMLRDFAAFYLAHKQNADCICHMGYIVEAHLFREMHHLGHIGEWDAPYPLLDVSGNLQQVGEDPTSVDNYAKKHRLPITDYGSTHNPLYDCEVAAKVYMHLTR